MTHATFPSLDGVAAFGLLAGFFTTVLIGYRRQLQTRLPVIAVGLACCGIYGFLQGAWPVGFVLVALTASEIRNWWHDHSLAPSTHVPRMVIQHDRLVSESRIHRMFGPA